MTLARLKSPSALRRFLDSQANAGLFLMAMAALALVLDNSPLAPDYEAILRFHVGPLSLAYWINDALMAVFFLLVGLEIKREMLDGQLVSWSRRLLPGIAALGGMVVPALLFFGLNSGETARGWAIPTATDIAFALGVISLLGTRVPASLKVFLAALAIIDDLGAVIIIALFYTAQISMVDLACAGGVVAILIALNRLKVRRLLPYLLLGALLWFFVFRSGIHATIAGVVLALTIPLDVTPSKPDSDAASPLHRLEKALHIPVGFIIVPLFALVNAGVPVLALPLRAFAEPVTLGIAVGLLLGKPIGVFGFTALAVRLGLADAPAHASRMQMLGVALLCGIGFTMSLFITLLAFPGAPILQSEAKIGILAGSLISGLAGFVVLRLANREIPDQA